MAHCFTDEWLVRAVQTIPGVAPSEIELFRKEKISSIEDGLILKKLADHKSIADAVSATYKLQPAIIEGKDIDRLALSMVPEKTCKRYLAVPFHLKENFVDVAMCNPLNMDAISDLEVLTGRKVQPFYCSKKAMESIFAELFNTGNLLNELLEKYGTDEEMEVITGDGNKYTKELNSDLEAPVIKLVNSIITKGVRQKASDIHIEQSERITEIRYRIDGILKNVMSVPKHIGAGALVARIKIMADLDIADHMRPQDGRAKLKVAGKEIGLRVSTLPTNFGEKVVMRILDPKSAERPLEDMGFGSNNIARLDSMVQASQGMILVTGPTGSGKTTTLYSILNKLKSEQTNIVTVEDPIEYKLAGINQVQINERQGLGFPTVLRSVLRQDPDIILVGEIRDIETASIAFQAALTGHLVFSTLHTNDTISTLSRLVDMGVERFKIAPALLAITAQRLVRKLCPACKQTLPSQESDVTIVDLLKRKGYEGSYSKSVGCESCQFSGYSGRLALLELLQPTRELREKIGAGADEGAVRELAFSQKALQTMLDDALWHLSRGDTTLEEITPYITLDDRTRGEDKKPTEPVAMPIPTSPSVQLAQMEPMPPDPEPTMTIPISKPQVVEQPTPDVVVKPPAPEEALPAPAMTEPDFTPASIKKEARALLKSSGPTKVLVVDDDETIRIMMRVILEKEGFGVIEAEDGKSAILKALHDGPDLMVLDLNMPNMGGNDVIRFLRNETSGTQIPIIVLTSESDEKNQEETLNAGADDYIVKPLKPPLVMARVKAAMRRKEN